MKLLLILSINVDLLSTEETLNVAKSDNMMIVHNKMFSLLALFSQSFMFFLQNNKSNPVKYRQYWGRKYKFTNSIIC